MTQAEMERELAAVTGESLSEIRRRGFSLLEAPVASTAPGRRVTPGAGPRLLLPEELAGVPRGGLMRKILALSAPDPDPERSSRPAPARRGPAPPKRNGG